MLYDIAACLSNIPTVLTLCETFSANSTITVMQWQKVLGPTDINFTFTKEEYDKNKR